MIGGFFRACTAFAKSLVAPREREVCYTENGNKRLSNWDRVPEEDVLTESAAQSQRSPLLARFALFVFDGPHTGEVFILPAGTLSVGGTAEGAIVLTAPQHAPDQRCRLFANGEIAIVPERGHFLAVNRAEVPKARLYDFDEVELRGNRCLVLDLKEEGVHHD